MEDPKKTFIECNSDSDLLKYDSFDRYSIFIKEQFNIDLKDIMMYVKTESDGFFLVEPNTYKDLKSYLNRNKSNSKFTKSVIPISVNKSYFRPNTDEYLINEDKKVGYGYILKNEFKSNTLGRDLDPEIYEKRNEIFLTSKIEEKTKEMLERVKKEEIDYLEEKKKEMNEAYKELLEKINDLTRNKNVYYKSYFEKVLRSLLNKQGITLVAPQDSNMNEENMKCCFCGEDLKVAFHYQTDENYVVCERCVEIHSDYCPFNFVKNKIKKVVKEEEKND